MQGVLPAAASSIAHAPRPLLPRRTYKDVEVSDISLVDYIALHVSGEWGKRILLCGTWTGTSPESPRWKRRLTRAPRPRTPTPPSLAGQVLGVRAPHGRTLRPQALPQGPGTVVTPVREPCLLSDPQCTCGGSVLVPFLLWPPRGRAARDAHRFFLVFFPLRWPAPYDFLRGSAPSWSAWPSC